ncbi:MAG: hypothetical protein LAN62_08540 [Acidobacteriia bacterium]|nr:hypothetical protein [Terriglobia bacterium]
MSSSRIQPSLTKSESDLVDQVAELTHAKRTEVIKNALAVYHWFVRQALTGARVIARKPTGEEVSLETPELTSLEGRGNKLSPEELGLLARKLATTKDAYEAARLRERITRGFYGI